MKRIKTFVGMLCAAALVMGGLLSTSCKKDENPGDKTPEVKDPIVIEFSDLKVYEWLQKKSHVVPPTDDRIFALIGPDDELDRDNFLQFMDTTPGTPQVVYRDEYGYILVEYNK